MSTFGSFSFSNGKRELGSQITININRNPPGATHSVKAAWLSNNSNDTSETSHEIWLAGPNSNFATNQVIWTPPLSIAEDFPTERYVMIAFQLFHKGDSSFNDATGYSFYIPDKVKPTLSDFTLSDPSGNYSKFGAYVATKSSLKATIIASGAYGSTIKQYKLSIGSTYATSTASSITINANKLTSSGTINVTATATDSRDRYNQKTKQITVLPYSAPSLSGSTAYRYNISSGKEDDESTTVRVKCVGSIASLNSLNSATVKIEYKLQSASIWTTYSTSNQGISWNYTVDILNLDSNYAYNIRLTAIDETGTQVSNEYDVPTATPVMDFLGDGKGLAIGKVSSSQGFEVAWPTKFESSATFDGDAQFNANATVNRLYYKVDGRSREPIYMIEGDANGDGIKMQAGGLVVIGSGESATAVANGYGYADGGGGYEYTHICSDNSVYIQTGCQNGFSTRKEFIFGSNGTLTIPSHIYMKNNSALCGQTTSGTNTPLLRMNTSNQVELTWTSGGLKGRVWKQIWSGTWSSGSLTLADLPYYNVLVMETDLTTGSMLVGFRDPNGYFVFSGIDENSSHYIIMACSTTASGTKLTMNMRPWKMFFNVGWEGVDSLAGSVKRIYGVL